VNRRAFTLLELLLCIVIIGALVTLIAGSLADARRKALGLRTLAHLRTTSTILHLYATDWRDAWPAFAQPGGSSTTIETSRGPLVVPFYFMSGLLWAAAIADYSFDGNDRSPSLFDAEQVAAQGGVGGPTFLLSCALFADHQFWTSGARLGHSQWRGTRRFEVWRTDKKALLVSPFVFHSEAPIRNVAGPYGRFVAPMAFVDGSALRVYSGNLRQGIMWGEGTFPGTFHTFDAYAGLHTIDGTRGTDIR